MNFRKSLNIATGTPSFDSRVRRDLKRPWQKRCSKAKTLNRTLTSRTLAVDNARLEVPIGRPSDCPWQAQSIDRQGFQHSISHETASLLGLEKFPQTYSKHLGMSTGISRRGQRFNDLLHTQE